MIRQTRISFGNTSLVLPAALFGYTAAIRVWGITRHFWMHYDQIRDWRIALGSFGDLPLVGPVTHLGGHPPGPAFYWALWFIRITIGPWFDDLPHAGGIGQALFHSAADVLLFFGIRRRSGSAPLALAIVLLVASAPYDLALSSTIWNPMMAVTFAKVASALVLLGWGEREPWRAAVTAAAAWAAVQSHFGGVFVAAAVLLSLVAHPLVLHGWRLAASRALLISAVVAVMQVPWVVYWLQQPPGTPGTPVGASLLRIVTGEQAPRIVTSAIVLGRAFASIQASPWVLPHLGWLLGLCALVVIVRKWRDVPVLAVSIGSLVTVCAGFALWVGGYHDYYYFSVMPAAQLTVGLGLTSLGPLRVQRAAAWTLLAVAVAAQPARLARSATIHRMPEYRPLVRASRAMAARGQPLRRIEAAFVPATSSPTFCYEILGGRLSGDSPWVAIVNLRGEVRYEQADVTSPGGSDRRQSRLDLGTPQQ
jgi:hypothetical protein